MKDFKKALVLIFEVLLAPMSFILGMSIFTYTLGAVMKLVNKFTHNSNELPYGDGIYEPQYNDDYKLIDDDELVFNSRKEWLGYFPE